MERVSKSTFSIWWTPNKSIEEAYSKLNVDEISCKKYVQHLEFLAEKAEKRKFERNTIPDICWTSEKDVKGLTNRQLKLYLKQNNL
jgi:hypothetical protein